MNKFFTSILFLLLFASPLGAHEGEVHEEEKPPSPVTAVQGMISQETSTETVELLLKHPPIKPEEKVGLRLFLATAEENLPIANAKVDLEISNLKDFKVSFKPIPNQPGLYSAETVFPKAGSFDAVVSISGGEINDLLTLPGIQVGNPQEMHSPSYRRWIIGGVGVAVFATLLVIIFVLYQKRRRSPKHFLFLGTILLGATIVTIRPASLLAHEGEVHGPEEKPEATQAVSTGNLVFLTKESQFLLKVQTAVAKNETVFDSVQALGKITHRATGQQDIFAPGAGRFIAPPSGRGPLVGEQVRRGQVLGQIEIIGLLTLKAPFDGVVSFVGFHPGERVETGAKLLSIADSKTVWVEGQLFEKDLSKITTGSKATITVDNLPDRTFPGKILGIGKTLDEQTRTALVTIEVPNPEGLLKIGQWAKVFIETATPLQAIIIPKSALLIKEGLPIVFVKKSAEQFEGRIVTVGGEFQNKVYVTSGVSEGEKVVTQGNYQLLPFLKTMGR